MSNMCVTSSLEGGSSPYEKWLSRKPSLQHLQPFGTVGYARKGKRAHKLGPRGEQYVMLGIAHNRPRDTVKVLVVQTEQIVNRQFFSWHSETAPGGPISPAPAGDNNTAEPVGARGSTKEAHTTTQLAQMAEEESEPSEPSRSPGSASRTDGNREARASIFNQHIYAETVAKRFNVTKTSMISITTAVKPLSKEDGPRNPKEKEEMRRIPYKEAVGALMWAATMTRPDLSFAGQNFSA